MSRMWMVPPPWMCDNHIRGEHSELHQIVGTIKSSSISIDPWVRDGFVFPTFIIQRHNQLVEEFANRGWPSGKNHDTPIKPIDLSRFSRKEIDVKKNLKELVDRCDKCALRAFKKKGIR